MANNGQQPQKVSKTYQEQVREQLRTMKIPEDSIFTPRSLETFSPYQIVRHATLHREATRKDGSGTFDSTQELIEIRPKANPNVTINVVVFSQDWEQIRSLLTLHPPSPFINSENDDQAKPRRILYTFAGNGI